MEKKKFIIPSNFNQDLNNQNSLTPLPFNIICLGVTRAGKSSIIYNLFQHEIRKNIDIRSLYIFSPTFKQDSTWSILSQELKNDKEMYSNNIKSKLKKEYIKAIFDYQKYKYENDEEYYKSKESRKICIIDDSVGNQNLKRGFLPNSCTISRHYNISFIFITQYMKSLNPAVRKNASYVIISSLSNEKELECCADEWNSGIGSNIFIQIYYWVRSLHDYAFLCIDMNKPWYNGRFMYDFYFEINLLEFISPKLMEKKPHLKKLIENYKSDSD